MPGQVTDSALPTKFATVVVKNRSNGPRKQRGVIAAVEPKLNEFQHSMPARPLSLLRRRTLEAFVARVNLVFDGHFGQFKH